MGLKISGEREFLDCNNEMELMETGEGKKDGEAKREGK